MNLLRFKLDSDVDYFRKIQQAFLAHPYIQGTIEPNEIIMKLFRDEQRQLMAKANKSREEKLAKLWKLARAKS